MKKETISLRCYVLCSDSISAKTYDVRTDMPQFASARDGRVQSVWRVYIGARCLADISYMIYIQWSISGISCLRDLGSVCCCCSVGCLLAVTKSIRAAGVSVIPSVDQDRPRTQTSSGSQSLSMRNNYSQACCNRIALVLPAFSAVHEPAIPSL